MILKFIFLLSLCQLALYAMVDLLKIPYGKTLILLTILAGNIFLFPRFFIPIPQLQGVNCGMPALAITFSFWIVGNIIALVTHFIGKGIHTFFQKYEGKHV